MKTILAFSIATAFIWTITALGAPATAVSLRGVFIWSNEGGQKHQLDAKLSPIGTNEWQAVWNFDWKQRPVTFTGAVKGSLQNGLVTGTGDSTDGRRHFTFTGTAKDGVITFEHYEVTHGKNRTGTGELRAAN